MKVQPNELLAIKHCNTAEEKQSRVVRVGDAETASQNTWSEIRMAKT
jgi:hypothetical protein